MMNKMELDKELENEIERIVLSFYDGMAIPISIAMCIKTNIIKLVDSHLKALASLDEPEELSKIDKYERTARRLNKFIWNKNNDTHILVKDCAKYLRSQFPEPEPAVIKQSLTTENEFCEWETVNKDDGMSHASCSNGKHLNYGFNFCPFCGKPLKIKE